MISEMGLRERVIWRGFGRVLEQGLKKGLGDGGGGERRVEEDGEKAAAVEAAKAAMGGGGG